MMGLHSWNQGPDPYSFEQLDTNWQILDFHDHTPGRGVQIPAGGLAPGSVGTLQLDPTVALVPTGTVILWTTNSPPAPSGFLVCDGSNYQQIAFPGLFAVIGTLYNNSASATPTSYFGVPWITMGPPGYGQLSWVIRT